MICNSCFCRVSNASAVSSITLVMNEAVTFSWIRFYDFTFWLIKSIVTMAFLINLSLSLRLFLPILVLGLSSLLLESKISSKLCFSICLNRLFLSEDLKLDGDSRCNDVYASSLLLISSFWSLLLICFNSLLEESDKESVVVLVAAPSKVEGFFSCSALS